MKVNDDTRIRKITINNKEFIELGGLKFQLGLLGTYFLLNENNRLASAVGAVLGLLDEDDLYDCYPKNSNKDSNTVNLFGDDDEQT